MIGRKGKLICVNVTLIVTVVVAVGVLVGGVFCRVRLLP
jgi:hypothetical protein